MVDVSDIKSLDEQIRVIISQKDLPQYLELTQDLVQRYQLYPKRVNFMKKVSDSVKDKIIADYLIRASLFVEPTIRNRILEHLSHNQKQEPSNVCPECNSTNIEEDICMNCGFEITNVAEEFSYRDGMTMTLTRRPIYERLKHFRELLYNYQGKISHEIPIEIIEQLRNCFRINGIDEKKVTRGNLYRFLLEISHSELYYAVNYLYSYFTGKKLPSISQFEDVLIHDYQQLQQAFNSLTIEEKQDRSNILKSTIVLKALLIRHKIKFEKDCFPDLKSDERGKQYTNILEVLFQRLRWKSDL